MFFFNSGVKTNKRNYPSHNPTSYVLQFSEQKWTYGLNEWLYPLTSDKNYTWFWQTNLEISYTHLGTFSLKPDVIHVKHV